MTQPRALIVVTHLLGVGHLARMAALGRALAAAGWAVTLVSGGRASATIETGGLDFVPLPAVHCRNGDFSRLLDDEGQPITPALEEERARLVCATFDAVVPDLVITELYPFGRRRLAREFEALLAAVEARRPRPLLLTSIRDVLNPPGKPGRAEAVLARLAAYDAVLVHGDETLPLARSWPVTPDLARQLRYVGYLRDNARDAPERMRDGMRTGIIVSAGGSDAGIALSHAAIEAARLIHDQPWRILVSHAIAPATRAALQACAPAHVIVEPARRDFPTLLAEAAISVSQAGYNTVLDLAATASRAVLVPFSAGEEREQSLRAEAIAERGLARIVPEAGLTGASLAAAIRAVATDPAPDWSGIRLDGAAGAVQAIESLMTRKSETETGWQRLDSLVREMESRGESLDFWLRDDDVVAVTPALERFLAQIARFGLPAGLAAIPTKLERGLAERLAQQPGICLLVHGHGHRNHALPGEKDSEFGTNREASAMRAELADSLARLTAFFGPRALPVFVPPWNRIDPAIARTLPGLGYKGLSTFAEKRVAGDLPGFVQANCHWDPIDWRGTRGLKPQAELLGDVLRLMEKQLALHPGERRPIGLLTHHLVHDGWIERFLDQLFERLGHSRAIHWPTVPAVFGLRDEQRV